MEKIYYVEVNGNEVKSFINLNPEKIISKKIDTIEIKGIFLEGKSNSSFELEGMGEVSLIKQDLYSPEALVDLIMEGDLSISRIAKETNIPLPTLKNYVYGKTDTASMPYRMIKDLTDFFRKGQPLELMLEDNDCVMLSGLDNAVIQFPHIKNSRIHTFKVLSELNYRYNIRKDDKDTKFEPFLVVLTKEMLEFCECGMFACSLLQTAIENCDSFNVRFVTTEYILMASHLSYLRYMWFERRNIKMFVKCNDNNGIKKLSELDKATGIKQHIISMLHLD